MQEGRPATEGEFINQDAFVSLKSAKALEHYEDLADIKRAIVHTTVLQPEVGAMKSLFVRTYPISLFFSG
jgi:hypothetical protein